MGHAWFRDARPPELLAGRRDRVAPRPRAREMVREFSKRGHAVPLLRGRIGVGSLFGLGEVGPAVSRRSPGPPRSPSHSERGRRVLAACRRRGGRAHRRQSVPDLVLTGTRLCALFALMGAGRCSPSGARSTARGGGLWPGRCSPPSRSGRTSTPCFSSAQRRRGFSACRPRRPVFLGRSCRRRRSPSTFRSSSSSAATARQSRFPRRACRDSEEPRHQLQLSREALGGAVAALLVLVGLGPLVHLTGPERRGALITGSLRRPWS